MRRALVVALVIGLMGGVLVGPADAKKKKKAPPPPPPPVTFEASGSFATSNPADFWAGGGVTRNEFLASCSLPASQGVDGYVVELSEEISKVSSTAVLTGSDATGIHDFDMYFFGEDCVPAGEVSTTSTSEIGIMPAGVKYVLVTAFAGAELEFTLEAEQLQATV